MENDIHLIANETMVCRGVDQHAWVKPNVEVVDSATRPAHRVLVGIAAPIEQRHAGADIDLTCQAKLNEQIKGGVDRRDRDSGEVPRNGPADLLGSGMAFTPPQFAQDHETLRCDPLSPRAQQIDEPLIILRQGRGIGLGTHH